MLTEEDKENFERGEKNRDLKKKEFQESLSIVPPTKEELLFIHNIFTKKRNTENQVFISKTKLQNLTIAHPQVTNVHNSIFGGYLLRLAFELAFSNAIIFSKRYIF